MTDFVCINIFKDRAAERYVQKGEIVSIDSSEEIGRLTSANCIRPMPEGPRATPPASPPSREVHQGPAETPAVETTAVEQPERQAHAGRRRGRKARK